MEKAESPSLRAPALVPEVDRPRGISNWKRCQCARRMSFQDRLCLAIAKTEGWTGVSNDKQLRSECKVEKVSVLWQFEVLALLVDARALTATAARDLAKKIAETNKRIAGTRSSLDSSRSSA